MLYQSFRGPASVIAYVHGPDLLLTFTYALPSAAGPVPRRIVLTLLVPPVAEATRRAAGEVHCGRERGGETVRHGPNGFIRPFVTWA